MEYKVKVSFLDLEDDGHQYQVGDIYPRAGQKPSDKRIKDLSSSSNKLHRPVIEKEVKKTKSEVAEEHV